MNPIEAIRSVFRNYTNFGGRAPRSEFWWFFLFGIVVSIVANAIHSILFIVVTLVLLLPYLTVAARRLQDTGRTAWWNILIITFVLGIIFSELLQLIISDAPTDNNFALAFWWYDNRSLVIFMGIWIVASFVGWVVLLILCISRGNTGPNRYGPDPLQLEADMDVNGCVGGSYEPSESPLPKPGARLYCPQCGAERAADAQFCTACGRAV